MVDKSNASTEAASPCANPLAYIPYALTEYRPEDAQIFLRSSDGKSQRCIFTDLPLTEFEQEHWEGMIKWVTENELVLAEHFVDNERKMLRYLQASKFDYQKCFDAITNFMEWETKLPPLDEISQRVYNVI
jgi:hypothetical protein